MKLSTTKEMAEWYRREKGKEPSAKALELARYFVRLCEGLEELGRDDAARSRPALSKSTFQRLLEDVVHGRGVRANQFRLAWTEAAQVCYMRGYNESNRQ